MQGNNKHLRELAKREDEGRDPRSWVRSPAKAACNCFLSLIQSGTQKGTNSLHSVPSTFYFQQPREQTERERERRAAKGEGSKQQQERRRTQERERERERETREDGGISISIFRRRLTRTRGDERANACIRAKEEGKAIDQRLQARYSGGHRQRQQQQQHERHTMKRGSTLLTQKDERGKSSGGRGYLLRSWSGRQGDARGEEEGKRGDEGKISNYISL